MLDIRDFVKILDVEFFAGVPDSRLKALCDYLIDNYAMQKHIIAANEGNAAALAAGYHLATGKVPCVYLQNSGIGNIINPVTSLLSEKVYGIPCIFVIGWRGEPDLKDEPQHIFQGEITLDLLEAVHIEYMVVDQDCSLKELSDRMAAFNKLLESGNCVAFVVKKDALSYKNEASYENHHRTSREEIIKAIIRFSGDDILVSTTGKASRELFELRKYRAQGHKYDFLTVGSMGHSSSIAMGIALAKPQKKVWCIDGDGSLLMHMGSMGVIGATKPQNFIHILINNESHESVGGQPTVSGQLDFKAIAQACGYTGFYQAADLIALEEILTQIRKEAGPIFIEAKAAICSRTDLGRPTLGPKENKEIFMANLKEDN